MTTRRTISGLALAAALCLAATAGCRKHDLQFDLAFKDPHGLQPGQAVFVGDEKAGQVVAVKPADTGVRVTIKIDGKHAGKVFRESTFSVEKPGGYFDRTDARQVRVRARAEGGTPVKPGEVIAGTESAVDEALGKLGAMGAKAFDAVRGWAGKGAEFAKQLPTSEDAKALRESITRFGEQAQAMAAEQAAAFQKEQLPEIKARAEQYRKALEQAGKSEEAKKFAEQFEQWLRGATK